MPNARHDTILRLIAEHDVTTQEVLCELLRAEGFSVTQATVSRDIRQLRLHKKRNARGVSCYAKTAAQHAAPGNLLENAVLRIDCAMNTVVVTCHPGSAQAACAVLDRLSLESVVGTIAGDDTIFMLTRSEQSAVQLVNLLETQIWGS